MGGTHFTSGLIELIVSQRGVEAPNGSLAEITGRMKSPVKREDVLDELAATLTERLPGVSTCIHATHEGV
jgi:hypothetical protein